VAFAGEYATHHYPAQAAGYALYFFNTFYLQPCAGEEVAGRYGVERYVYVLFKPIQRCFHAVEVENDNDWAKLILFGQF
jgi:hypothetical protein